MARQGARRSHLPARCPSPETAQKVGGPRSTHHSPQKWSPSLRRKGNKTWLQATSRVTPRTAHARMLKPERGTEVKGRPAGALLTTGSKSHCQLTAPGLCHGDSSHQPTSGLWKFLIASRTRESARPASAGWAPGSWLRENESPNVAALGPEWLSNNLFYFV